MTWQSKTYQGRWSELDNFYQSELNENNKMNTTNKTDLTFMSLAMADFALAGTQLVAHDYYVAGGLVIVGVVLVYLYHKFGSTTTQ